MLGLLPDECKQKIWCFFEAQELCRVVCVARGIAQGANADAVWKRRTQALIAKEQTRITMHRTPSECGLQRQNGSRNLMGKPTAAVVAVSSSSRSITAAMSALSSSDRISSVAHVMVAEDSTFWRHWYRDFYVSIRSFDAAHASFEAAKTEIQELKRERGDLKEMLQAAKSKHQSEKQLRRMQMNCVRWMNRSHRRMAASTSLKHAQTAALSKAEINDELQVLEANIQVQSRMIFSLRSQYQKSLHRMTAQLARGTQMLRDLGDVQSSFCW